MQRREFISLLGGAAAAWPLAALAQQQPALPVIGWLSSARASMTIYYISVVRQGLSDMGYVEGRNVAIEARFAEDDYDRLPALAADLVRRRVNVILASSDPSILAAKAATQTIPIVFTSGLDPVKSGIVDSLNRPGGNLTGGFTLNVELVPKRLELLHELLPTATAFGVLINPANPNSQTLPRDLQSAARALGVQIHILHARAERDFDTAFATLAQLRAGGLVIAADPFFTNSTEQLAALSVRHAMPTIFQYREFAAAGGLMSY